MGERLVALACTGLVAIITGTLGAMFGSMIGEAVDKQNMLYYGLAGFLACASPVCILSYAMYLAREDSTNEQTDNMDMPSRT